jgi:hypothetical protein
MKEVLKSLLNSIGPLMRGETRTTPGRVNLVGMVLSVLLVVSLTLTSFFEAIVRIFRPQVKLGTPVLQLFIVFVVFTLGCAVMVAYLEPEATKPRQPEKRKATAEDQPQGAEPASDGQPELQNPQPTGYQTGEPSARENQTVQEESKPSPPKGRSDASSRTREYRRGWPDSR